MDKINQIKKKRDYLQKLMFSYENEGVDLKKSFDEIKANGKEINQYETEVINLQLLFFKKITEILKARSLEANELIEALHHGKDKIKTIYSNTLLSELISDLKTLEESIDHNNIKLTKEITIRKDELNSIINEDSYTLK